MDTPSKWLNDIKVYDNVINDHAQEQIFRYLSQAFYSLQRSNDADACDKAKLFLSRTRTEDEIKNYQMEHVNDMMKHDPMDPMRSADMYWTRVHKNDPNCNEDDSHLCTALYEALTSVCTVPSFDSCPSVYTNLLRSGDRPKAHVDNVSPKNRTVMFYLNDEWNRDWGGETIFYDLNDEITKAVLPKPGRVVSFDGRIPHSARPPLTAAHRPRYITVMKF